MAGSERKKKLKGIGWIAATSNQVVNIYSTSLQIILNELWTMFPNNLKQQEEDNLIDINQYNNLINCFNISFVSKDNIVKEMATNLIINGATKEDSIKLEKEILDLFNLLHSGGKGLKTRIISNKKRGRMRLRIKSTYKLYIYFAKSQKNLTTKQENATFKFTEQVKSHYLPNI